MSEQPRYHDIMMTEFASLWMVHEIAELGPVAHLAVESTTGEVDLHAAECRQLAAALIRAAELIEASSDES